MGLFTFTFPCVWFVIAAGNAVAVPFSADLGGFPMGKAVIEPWQAHIQLLSPILVFFF